MSTLRKFQTGKKVEHEHVPAHWIKRSYGLEVLGVLQIWLFQQLK